jgi:DNA polymerase III subunit epsilon
MREIVLDTETTGLDPKSGHRVVEIGCVELINHVATSETFHKYINPERDMPEEAFRVHGLSQEFLKGYPVFSEIAVEFLTFIGDSPLVIHNADFDMGFLNAELAKVKLGTLDMSRAIDTVRMARKKFPGAPANLDALCKRFQIDNSNRELHGALLDARLLADVYLELTGGRQQGLELAGQKSRNATLTPAESDIRPPRPHAPSAEEEAAHRAFLEKLDTPLWLGKES